MKTLKKRTQFIKRLVICAVCLLILANISNVKPALAVSENSEKETLINPYQQPENGVTSISVESKEDKSISFAGSKSCSSDSLVTRMIYCDKMLNFFKEYLVKNNTLEWDGTLGGEIGDTLKGTLKIKGSTSYVKETINGFESVRDYVSKLIEIRDSPYAASKDRAIFRNPTPTTENIHGLQSINIGSKNGGVEADNRKWNINFTSNPYFSVKVKKVDLNPGEKLYNKFEVVVTRTKKSENTSYKLYADFQLTEPNVYFKEYREGKNSLFTMDVNWKKDFEFKAKPSTGTVTVNYIDDKGNSINPSKMYTGFLGTSYKLEPKEIEGYVLTGKPSNSEGEYKEIPQTVNFVYEKKEKIEVIPKPQMIVLGEPLNITPSNAMNYLEVKSGKGLTVKSVKNTVDNSTVGIQNVIVELQDKYGTLKTVEIPITIQWGNSIRIVGVKDNTGVALTLHDLETNPYITAKIGDYPERANNWIHDGYNQKYYEINQYRLLTNSEELSLNDQIYSFSAEGHDARQKAIEKFAINQSGKLPVQKGDIIESWVILTNNNRLMVNEKEVTENRGLQSVFYEITNTGYHPLRFNQLVAKEVHVKNGASQQELIKKLQETIDLKGYQNITIDRYKDKLPDTTKDGKQTVDVVVRETLQSGKQVEYTYPATFVINPVITENIYNSDGMLLETTQTEIQYNKDSFKPNPISEIAKDGIQYRYDGWLEGNQKPGVDIPKSGKPDEVKETKTLQYVYTDLNRTIHVTLPIEMVFSSNDQSTKQITSNLFRVENHAKDTKLHMQLEKFETKESAGIQLLKPSDSDPTQPTEAMRLNLLLNGKEKIKSLNDTSAEIDFGTMNPKDTWMLQFEGTYFGEIKEEKKVTNHSMIWKFSAQI